MIGLWSILQQLGFRKGLENSRRQNEQRNMHNPLSRTNISWKRHPPKYWLRRETSAQMQNLHDDLNESMELERQKIATRYLRVCIEPLWGVETPWYIFYASLLVLTDWVHRNLNMENVRQAMAIGLDWRKLKSKSKSMYSIRILLLSRVPIEVKEFSTWSISKLSQLLPCFRWGRRGDFASEQKFLVVINILGGDASN